MIESLYKAYLNSTGVSIDTRTLQEGNIWFALKGPNFDANKFIDQALSKGAAYVVVDSIDDDADDRYLLVEDALQALQELAAYHRKQLKIPFLAITGSNGKTTTKELVRDVLSRKYRVLATEGNLNNHIGVPLTILKIHDKIEFAVIEMGANAQKEIVFLCQIAQPDYGLITNIGKAHLEGFGGLEGVFKGKTEMFDFLYGTKGSAFVNTNFPKLVEKLSQLKISFRSYPNSGDDLHLELLSEQSALVLQLNGTQFQTKITGAYNKDNIAAALCVGDFFGVNPSEAIDAVKNYDPDNNRSQVLERASNLIVLDAYNANPSSMREALLSFERRAANRKVVILGDMLELGKDAEEEHYQVGLLLKELNIDEIHLCGPLMKAAHKANAQASYWEKKADLADYLKGRQYENTQMLIKGSRGMSLETLLAFL